MIIIINPKILNPKSPWSSLWFLLFAFETVWGNERRMLLRLRAVAWLHVLFGQSGFERDLVICKPIIGRIGGSADKYGWFAGTWTLSEKRRSWPGESALFTAMPKRCHQSYSTAHLKQKTAEESKTVPMAFILEASELLGTSSTCPSHTDLTIQGS